MGYFIPEKELKIYEFNRLITDLGQLSTSSFLTQIQKNFEVTEINASEFVPKQNHEIKKKRVKCVNFINTINSFINIHK